MDVCFTSEDGDNAIAWEVKIDWLYVGLDWRQLHSVSYLGYCIGYMQVLIVAMPTKLN
jgi:hypothetical protein